jgi:hypothetical protein
MMSKLRELAYAIDPALWVHHVLGVEPAVWQAQFLRAPLGASILALTARQVGKTTTAAWAIAHFMLFTPGGLSVTRGKRTFAECRDGMSTCRRGAVDQPNSIICSF